MSCSISMWIFSWSTCSSSCVTFLTCNGQDVPTHTPMSLEHMVFLVSVLTFTLEGPTDVISMDVKST